MVDLLDGRIVRSVDYWSGREFPAEALAAQRVPAEAFPAEFGEADVKPAVPDSLAALFTWLTDALGTGDVKALARLPYASGSIVHMVGAELGGAYEWVTGEGPVRRGLVVVELADDGLIDRLTAVWDNSLLDTQALTSMFGDSVDR